MYRMKMKTITAIVLFICMFCATAFGNNLDSLRNEIKKHTDRDSNKVKAITNYIQHAIDYNTSDFLPYMNDVITISKKINFTRGIVKGYIIGQIYYEDRDKFEVALLYADSALQILNAIKKNPEEWIMKDIGNVHLNKGNVFYKIGNYNQAIIEYFTSIKFFEKYPNKQSIVYNNISSIYNELLDNEKRLYYDSLSLACAYKSNDESILCFSLVNRLTGLLNTQNYKQAIIILNQTKPLVEKLQNTTYLYSFYNSYGLILDYQNDNVHAINAFKKALEYSTTNQDDFQIADVLSALTKSLIDANKLTEAKSYLDTLLSIANRNQFVTFKAEAYKLLADWHFKNNDFEKSALSLQQYVLLNDTINSEQTKKIIANLDIKYQTQKKENEILLQQQQLKKRTIFIRILITCLLAISLFSFLFYRFLKQRNILLENQKTIQQQRITDLEKERQLEATESVLKGQEEERSRIAKDLHDGLGGLLSGVKYSLNNMKENVILSSENASSFGRTIDMLDSGIQELRRIAHNMMPENLVKFGLNLAVKDYCNSITKSNALLVNYSAFGMENAQLDTNVSVTVYRVIQELVNNIMKHANATEAIIQLSKEENILHIAVEDNGKGFDTTEMASFKGAGWTNIQHRVNYLKGSIQIDSNEKDGTSVNIEIPLA